MYARRTLQDRLCEGWPGAADVPEHVRECFREEGRNEQSGIHFDELIAGALVGFAVSVIGRKILELLTTK